jgi:hypothetical protein
MTDAEDSACVAKVLLELQAGFVVGGKLEVRQQTQSRCGNENKDDGHLARKRKRKQSYGRGLENLIGLPKVRHTSDISRNSFESNEEYVYACVLKNYNGWMEYSNFLRAAQSKMRNEGSKKVIKQGENHEAV